MISLRISEEEYESFKSYSQKHGARSVSELARIALHRLLGRHGGLSAGVELRLDEFDGRLRVVEHRMQEIAGPQL